MIDIYDKNAIISSKDLADEKTVCDANGQHLSPVLLWYLWARLTGKAETGGFVDWSNVEIKSHPKHLQSFDLAKVNMGDDMLGIFKRFDGNVKWMVDETIRPDVLQMSVGNTVGFWIRLQGV